ncbi:MAG TPA: rhomboid family intramembrane serine protease [Vicinamibacterales bacterium]|nr:rhomboid family intramembrane serine protease [Vicinamibacterales bacterium]HPW20282.1 rhomboid family intramembrane serine protease [Vicinamibacterales bacterium]
MIVPLSDAPNPGGRPFVTYALIAANVLLYVGISLPLSGQPADTSSPAFRAYVEVVRDQLPAGVPIGAVLQHVSAYDLFVFEHGYKPAAPQFADLLFSLFLHGGFLHLLGNMLFLWIYGDNVEYRLGRLQFLFWYIVTGIAATLAFAAFARGSGVPLVGASGAISGLLGFYFRWFPRNTVRLFVFLPPFIMNVVAVQARTVLGIYLVADNLLPALVTGGGGGGVAHGAHIGGFVAGLMAAWAIDRWEVRPATTAFPAGLPARKPEEQAAGAGGEEMARLASSYFALPADRTRRALEPRASLALANWLAGNGHSHAALVVYRRHLRDYPADATTAAAHLGAGMVQMEQMGQVAPAYQHFLEALDLDPDEDTAARARRALARIAATQKYNVGRPRPF